MEGTRGSRAVHDVAVIDVVVSSTILGHTEANTVCSVLPRNLVGGNSAWVLEW